jgi:DNA-binding CsgD family transcriptional regulator
MIWEAEAINETTRDGPLIDTSIVLAAWRGDEARALALIEVSVEDATAGMRERAVIRGEYAKALLYNGLGRYEAAMASAIEAGESVRALAELVEAATRSGSVRVAAEALRRLEAQAHAESTDWELGAQACSRALLGAGDDAEWLYLEAVARLTGTGSALHLARARLLFGEWLRRRARRVDARTHLSAAHGVLSRLGAEGFAERARRELLATGETVRKRKVETRDELTAQEALIADLAGDGYTSPEIGAQLYLSARTVEWHLHKVFLKLGISSRRQLRKDGRTLKSRSRP